MRVKILLRHKTAKSQSEEIQSLEKREASLDVRMYVAIGLVLAGVVVGNLPEFSSAVALASAVQHRGADVEVVIGLTIVFLSDVMLHKVRTRLKEISHPYSAAQR